MSVILQLMIKSDMLVPKKNTLPEKEVNSESENQKPVFNKEKCKTDVKREEKSETKYVPSTLAFYWSRRIALNMNCFFLCYKSRCSMNFSPGNEKEWKRYEWFWKQNSRYQSTEIIRIFLS